MKILSVSTATKNLSVAVSENETTLVEKNLVDQRNHSVNLMPTIEEALADAKIALNQIDRFVVADGPGSYTGLRIGATTVKVLADVLKKELVGVSTIAALAMGANSASTLIVPILDARNDNFFAGLYRQNEENKNVVKAVVADEHIHLPELAAQIKELVHPNEKIVILGEFTPEHQQQFVELLAKFVVTFGTADENIVHSGNVAQLGLLQEATDVNNFVPTYLRKTQAEIEWAKKTGNKLNSKDVNYVEEV